MIHIVSQKLILLLPTNWPRISSFFIGACFHPQSGGNRDSKWPAGMNELLFCMSECLYWFPCLLSSQCRDSLQPLLWPWKETGGWRIGITSKSKHAASCFFPHHIPVFSWCCYTTIQCFRLFFFTLVFLTTYFYITKSYDWMWLLPVPKTQYFTDVFFHISVLGFPTFWAPDWIWQGQTQRSRDNCAQCAPVLQSAFIFVSQLTRLESMINTATLCNPVTVNSLEN